MKTFLPLYKKCTKISIQKTEDSVMFMHTADIEELTESNTAVTQHLTPDCSRGNEPAISSTGLRIACKVATN